MKLGLLFESDGGRNAQNGVAFNKITDFTISGLLFATQTDKYPPRLFPPI
jgi:hypothetical protein